MEEFELHQIRQKKSNPNHLFLELLGLDGLENRLNNRYPNFFLFQFLIIHLREELLQNSCLYRNKSTINLQFNRTKFSCIDPPLFKKEACNIPLGNFIFSSS